MDLWEMIKSLFRITQGGESIESPREALIRTILEELLDPVQPELVTQEYFDAMSIFLFVAIPLFCFEVLARLYRAMKSSEYADELQQFGITAVFLFGLIPLLPGFLVSTQLAFNALGQWGALSFVGSSTPDEFVATVSTLSNNAGLDFLLSIVQITVLIVLAIGVIMVPIMLWLSGMALIIGVCSRWIKSVGEAVFRLSMSISLYGVFGNMTALLIIGLGMAAGRHFYDGNPTGLALANTGTLILAGWLTIKLLGSFKGQISAIAKRAAGGVSKLSGRGGGVRVERRSGGKSSRTSRRHRVDDTSSRRSLRRRSTTKDEPVPKTSRGHDDTVPIPIGSRRSTPRQHANTTARSRRSGAMLDRRRPTTDNGKPSDVPSPIRYSRGTEPNTGKGPITEPPKRRYRPTTGQAAKAVIVAAQVARKVK